MTGRGLSVLFNSFQFLVFFVVALVLYWSLWGRWRIYFLLAAGYFFYGCWDYRFLGLLFLTTVVDFVAGIAIHSATSPARRRLFLLLSLGCNLIVLGFFKYWNFFLDTFVDLLGRFGLSVSLPTLQVVLPVGISFYTFQSMSYTIDVYRRVSEPSRDFLTYAAYVAFFPQLVAGPIERFRHLYPQLAGRIVPNLRFMRRGVFLILQGYVRKVVIADGIAPIVDRAFAARSLDSGEALEAAILFTCQIYCDFAGYSDIARGTAYLLGIELAENFRTPLLSRSITEFWRRWHMSLSQWLRDYLYIPLGGNRGGPLRTYVNLLITMLLGGLWHGADWKFVIWGGLHGLLLALERRFRFDVTRAAVGRTTLWSWPGRLGWTIATFLAVVLIFVFFRAPSATAAYRVIADIAALQGLDSVLTPRLGVTLAAIFLLDLPLFLSDDQAWLLRWPTPVRVALYTVFLASLLVFSGGQTQTFIYFAF